MGGFDSSLVAIVKVSVIQVRRTPSLARSSISAFCSVVGSSKTRSDRSAAISVRAWLNSMSWNARLNPRTPVSDPTPTATARITNPNFNDDARASRQAIFAAVDQENFIADLLFADDQSVAQHDTAAGTAGERRIVRNQHQCCPFALVE